MKPPSACRALKDWLIDGRKHGRSQQWLATVLGTTQPTVYRWLSGENLPGTEYRLAIRFLTNGKVKLSMWFYPHQKRLAYRYKSAEARKKAGGGCK